MAALIVTAVWLCVVAYLLIHAVQQFSHYDVLQSRELQGEAPPVTVLVPARDEADSIGNCLDSLLALEYPRDKLSIVVVDDSSTDGTAEIVRGYQGRRPQVQLIQAGPLPEGWAGKPHALFEGVKQAQGDWFCFIDADVVAKPALLRSAMAFCKERGVDMLSLEPFQILGSFWERVILPAGMLMAGFAEDVSLVNDPDAPEATADGQFILICRRAYEAVGGHAAVRSAIAEDNALAHLIKRNGFRLYMMGGNDLVAVRMYTNLADIWEGLSKNAVDVLGSRLLTALGSIAGLAIGWASVLLPIWAGFDFAAQASPYAPWSLGLALLGSAAMFGTHTGETRYFRIPLWYGLLFPLGFTMISGIGLNGVRVRSGGSVSWKGRTYTSASQAADSTPAEKSR